jgi:hypothetical protein
MQHAVFFGLPGIGGGSDRFCILLGSPWECRGWVREPAKLQGIGGGK